MTRESRILLGDGLVLGVVDRIAYPGDVPFGSALVLRAPSRAVLNPAQLGFELFPLLLEPTNLATISSRSDASG